MLRPNRGSWRGHPRPRDQDAGHGPCRAAGEAEGARGEGRDRHALALLQAPADHAQKKTAHAAEQQRRDVRVARTAWFDGQLDLDPKKLIFIDETGTTTKMARLYGRAPRGERCRAAIP